VIRKIGAAILGDERRLLVVRKLGRDVFILPGGRLEAGETHEQALVRELREELGVEAVNIRPLLHATETAVFEGVELDLHVYSVEINGIPSPQSEIAELAFVTPDSHGFRLASGITKHVFPTLFPGAGMTRPDRAVALLFSGGRDSTVAVLELMAQGYEPHLIRFRSGMGIDNGLAASRVEELERVLSGRDLNFVTRDVQGLVRRICFVDLVDDVSTDGCQQILLGEACAMIASATVYCMAREIPNIAIGATLYQAHYPEQRSTSLDTFRGFANEYGVELLTPVANIGSELEIKERLRMAGLSTKSLESTSLLADIDDHQPEAAVAAYLQRKLPLMREFVDSHGYLG
jgi:8-oxo-dGTP pyrophosphatase MutT (NUDIX family)